MQAILFDLDNTLIDRDAAMLRWADSWDVAPLQREQALALDGNGKGNREELAKFLDQILPLEEAWSGAKVALQIANHVVVDLEILELLRRLRQRYRLGIVTNGGQLPQRRKLQNSGIDTIVDKVWISEVEGASKPEARIFNTALLEMKISAEDTLFVGDDFQCDIEGARRVGMQTCWLNLRATKGLESIQSIFELENILG